ncbi:MAG: hypothetical protein SRB2_00467 [Desulfobacteraceae bacterium Eth-SRB2]|nr:MAG: hypothetical protein SRB2_00467 [Desulfobacteraceae bacterium Eth-SRB2]
MPSFSMNLRMAKRIMNILAIGDGVLNSVIRTTLIFTQPAP